jgi:hypothetical protein
MHGKPEMALKNNRPRPFYQRQERNIASKNKNPFSLFHHHHPARLHADLDGIRR